MKKQVGASLLLAGTAIGSGMISLPMVLAKFGIIGTCLIMVLFAGLTYLTALIRADLNLNLYAEATLEDVGCAFGCPKAGFFGNFLLKLLHLTLMAAYLFGFSSILCSLFGGVLPLSFMMVSASIFIALIFLLASELIIGANKVLFTAMSVVFIALVLELVWQTRITFVPEQADCIKLSEWTTLIPVIFTSFGFQGSIHSMTKFCQNDRNLIKSACLWGSIIPAVVYMVWTAAILLVVSNTDRQFFQLMLEGNATDVGKLVSVLSGAASSRGIQIMVWIVSTLAMLTSVLGVGLSLVDIFQQEWGFNKCKIISFVVFVPALISMLIPNAFIRILNVSGIILSLIAIIVPVTISLKMQKSGNLKIQLLLGNKGIIFGVLICGIMVIALGLLDLVG